MLIGHGRATPLMWRTVQASTLKGNQRRYEEELLRALRHAMPRGVKVTVIADRGFGNGPVIQCLEALGFEYVLRIRGDFYVTNAKGEHHSGSTDLFSMTANSCAEIHPPSLARRTR